MATQNFVLGDRLAHPVHGVVEVSFVGSDHVGLRLADGEEVLMHAHTLAAALAAPPAEAPPPAAPLPWPESTFELLGDDVAHYLGSHWGPFTDNVREILEQLPVAMHESTIQTGAPLAGPARAIPADWPQGATLLWPQPDWGLAATVRFGPNASEFMAAFPFHTAGTRRELVIESVKVWPSLLEAQVAADCSGAELAFFDTAYVVNRSRYSAGESVAVCLRGIAYSAEPAAPQEFEVQQHPDVLAWENRHLPPGEQPASGPRKFNMDGAAVLMPISEWDIDDYEFRGPVVAVSRFEGLAGQERLAGDGDGDARAGRRWRFGLGGLHHRGRLVRRNTTRRGQRHSRQPVDAG
jgi:hypothetical protein